MKAGKNTRNTFDRGQIGVRQIDSTSSPSSSLLRAMTINRRLSLKDLVQGDHLFVVLFFLSLRQRIRECRSESRSNERRERTTTKRERKRRGESILKECLTVQSARE